MVRIYLQGWLAFRGGADLRTVELGGITVPDLTTSWNGPVISMEQALLLVGSLGAASRNLIAGARPQGAQAGAYSPCVQLRMLSGVLCPGIGPARQAD